MPDSERPTGDDSLEVERRPGDGSGSIDRRARTSTADRPSRAVRPRPADARSTDPRKDGVRTPPRRPKARPTSVVTGADDVDVAAALAAVPDADDLATDDSAASAPSGRNGGRLFDRSRDDTGEIAGDTNGVIDPLLVPADEDAVEDAVETTADPADSAVTVEAPEHVGRPDEDAADDATENPAENPAEDPASDTVNGTANDTAEEPADAANATVLLAQVAEPTEQLDTVEARDTEVIPRVYDVELDEPGAYAVLVPAVTEPAAVPAPYVPPTETVPVPVRRRRRPRVRRVTRVIRHVDTWTVFKVVVLFNLVLYATTLIAGVLLWNVAHGTGTIDNVERFMESFGWETFEFKGQELFDNGWRIGLFIALGLTGLAVLAATTFNLITDIVGGIRVTVLEEEVVVAGPDAVVPTAASPAEADGDDARPG